MQKLRLFIGLTLAIGATVAGYLTGSLMVLPVYLLVGWSLRSWAVFGAVVGALAGIVIPSGSQGGSIESQMNFLESTIVLFTFGGLASGIFIDRMRHDQPKSDEECDPEGASSETG
ncbi:MAG: hypothetical protein KDA86_18385 [Planctomycetaceae bacterium]|nr:hypothetical protein [Planctomycetaceae bacterium]